MGGEGERVKVVTCSWAGPQGTLTPQRLAQSESRLAVRTSANRGHWNVWQVVIFSLWPGQVDNKKLV